MVDSVDQDQPTSYLSQVKQLSINLKACSHYQFLRTQAVALR